MTSDKQSDYMSRHSVLQLLSDEENARVSNAESEVSLADGEQYLDLEHLHQGVLQAAKPMSPMGHVLPRRSVNDATWSKILAHLTASGISTLSSGQAG